ncbi:MAG: MgtC/SapB family protein [Candidatus Pacearchaeota archaeon]
MVILEIEWEIITRIIVAALLGLAIGIQRELRKIKEKTFGVAGMRTHSMLAMGTALIAAISVLFFPDDPARLVASIFTGIGFIGASTVLATRGRIIGLTNAATIWIAAAIGITAGLNLLATAIITTIASIIILELKRFEKVD